MDHKCYQIGESSVRMKRNLKVQFENILASNRAEYGDEKGGGVDPGGL